MVALFTGAVRVFECEPHGAFAERDSVVLADFANSTGEPVFDDTLKEALEVQLRQSPFLSVLPEQRVQGTLKLMGRKPGDRITPDDRARRLRADGEQGDDRRRDFAASASSC